MKVVKFPDKLEAYYKLNDNPLFLILLPLSIHLIYNDNYRNFHFNLYYSNQNIFFFPPLINFLAELKEVKENETST